MGASASFHVFNDATRPVQWSSIRSVDLTALGTLTLASWKQLQLAAARKSHVFAHHIACMLQSAEATVFSILTTSSSFGLSAKHRTQSKQRSTEKLQIGGSRNTALARSKKKRKKTSTCLWTLDFLNFALAVETTKRKSV